MQLPNAVYSAARLFKICGIDRVLLAQLFQQQLAAFVVEFLGHGIVAQVGLQISVRYQARGISRVIDAGFPAQYVETFGKKGFGIARIFRRADRCRRD